MTNNLSSSKMPRKNNKKNKSYNVQPQNGEPGNIYPNYYNYNMYQQYPNDFNDYNYHTNGRFEKKYRYNNQARYQNRQYTNENYGHRSYNNLHYNNSRYPQEYMNNYYTNGAYNNEGTNGVCNYEEYSQSKYNNYNTQEYTQAEYTNQEYSQAEYTNEEYSQAEYTNEEYSQAEYTNEEYSQAEYTNQEYSQAEYTNQEYTQSEYSNEYMHEENSNQEYTQADCTNENLTNTYHKVSEDGNTYEISSDSGCGTFSADTTVNKIDNSPEQKINRPSTRTILKISLKEKNELPKQINKEIINTSYTDNYWKKGKDSDTNEFEEIEEPCYVFQLEKNKKKKKSSKNNSQLQKANKFEKKVNKMLSAPVEMSKGRSLLEKMGWKGGGLGKDGDGIIEPIAPKAIYAATTMGLGQLTEEDVQEPEFIDHVYRRTLTYILEFVKNYLENELNFDKRLSRSERKRIHKTVEELRNGVVNSIPHPYRSIVNEIYHHNDYVLVTESSGKKKNRYLTLYKEAHEHMFLISPEDLQDEEEIDDKDTQIQNKTKTVNENTKTEEANNEDDQRDKEIKSDTENKDTDKDIKDIKEEKDNKQAGKEKDKPKDVNDILDIIINYLIDYTEDPLYTELRFLGPFNQIERCAIDMFFEVCKNEHKIERSKEVLDLFDCDDFYLELRLDNNGRYVIYKIEKKKRGKNTKYVV